MVSALQSGSYELIWEMCADLPSPASVAVHDNKVYTIAGGTPDRDTYVYKNVTATSGIESLPWTTLWYPTNNQW